VLRALTIAGEAVLVVGAVAILYLAFRGPSGHPTASAGPTTPSPPAPSATAGKGDGQVTATRPAAVSPPTAAATTAPAPTASASTSQTAGPLATQAQPYLAGRRGKTEVAVYDLSSGQQWTLGPQAPQAEGNLVGLEILQAVLDQRRVRRTVLSLAEQQLTPTLIEQNDNNATAALWADVGGAKGMRAFDHAARLVNTSPVSWWQTTSTPQDQITLLRQLARPSAVLDKNGQKYALKLLENATPAQRWGVSHGVPAGVTVALKNVALPLSAGQPGWQANSVGWVSGGGRNYLMAVLSTGNPSEQYGIDTLDRLGALTWNALAPGHG
jgi:hypothetical protein